MSDYDATPVIAMPQRDGSAVLRPLSFANLTQKAQWLDAMASLDASQPVVRKVATRIARQCTANRPYCIASGLQAVARDWIPYVYGDGHQRFFSSSELLSPSDGTELGGNCADKSRLFVALCRSVEIEARIVPIFHSPTAFVHVQSEVRWPGTEKDPRSENGGWLRAEVIVKGVGIGDGPRAGEHDAAGRLELA